MRIKDKKTDRAIFRCVWEMYKSTDYYIGNSSNMGMILDTLHNMADHSSIYYIRTTHTVSANCDNFILNVAKKAENISDITEVRTIVYNKLSSKERDTLNLIFYQSPGRFSMETRHKTKLLYHDKYVDLSALLFSMSSENTIEQFETKNITSIQLEDAKTIFFNVVNKIIYYYKEFENVENRKRK